ncbi:MAG: hypothetical protein ACRD35_02455, partial [Candidatus Acidiferrales bacterium]
IKGACKLEPAAYEEIKVNPEVTKQAIVLNAVISVEVGLYALFTESELTLLTALAAGFASYWLSLAMQLALLYMIARRIPHPPPSPTIIQFFRTMSFANAPLVFLPMALVPVVATVYGLALVGWLLGTFLTGIRITFGWTRLREPLVVTAIYFLVFLGTDLALIFLFTD